LSEVLLRLDFAMNPLYGRLSGIASVFFRPDPWRNLLGPLLRAG